MAMTSSMLFHRHCPQNPKTHIKCVSKVKLHLPSNYTLETSALLDTGSILNFVSKTLIEKIGSPRPVGTWCGSIKTVSGIRTISTPFYELALKDVNNGVHIIRCLMIDSIGQSSLLDYHSFMKICEILKINPKLVQQPTGDFIHLLIGLDSLNLLGHQITVIPDISVPKKTRKIHYPSPQFDNLRLFSTPLNEKLFMAETFRNPIDYS